MQIFEINKLHEKMGNYSLEDIKKQTKDFKEMFKHLSIENEEDLKLIKEILDKIKFEAFAILKRTCELINGKEFTLKNGEIKKWNMIPYDVQLMGGLNLQNGKISEMRTGEGKTLVATLPAYLNALVGEGVHVVTVNDYLAKRDSEELTPLYESLGLEVGYINSNQSPEEKKENYGKDVIYATNNELGFDYLRDNMIEQEAEKTQGNLFYAIIDEIDSILIDESRTPLIISSEKKENTEKYKQFVNITDKLEKGVDYTIDEKQKVASLKESGITKIEKILNVENIFLSEHHNDLHYIENAIKAKSVYKKDIDYIIENKEVKIVDEHTGRVLNGRRYGNGLHQAIEAKENVEIKPESSTLASITFQNYFRLYKKLCGMTGTAKTEEEEFYQVYRLETCTIPTNKPILRIDKDDLLFKNSEGKYKYLIDLITKINKSQRPILVGTVSIDKSEYLSQLLTKANLKHTVLNAKNHKLEAGIISKAGEKGNITIATNMAGRGTDIKLGEGVSELGGLYIIGTEKHETRRIDNQLRGRAGRQGDTGTTQFLISPTDEIMRVFGGNSLYSLFNSKLFASLPEETPLPGSNKILSHKILSIQKQVEGYHFQNRKNVLEYDDVINQHRHIIYKRRNLTISNKEITSYLKEMIYLKLDGIVKNVLSRKEEDGNNEEISKSLNSILEKKIFSNKDFLEKDYNEIIEIIKEKIDFNINSIKQKFQNEEDFIKLGKNLILKNLDSLWIRHIDNMTVLRNEVAFEGYAQKNPLIVYKEKAFAMFGELINDLEFSILKGIFEIKADNSEKVANEIFDLLGIKIDGFTINNKKLKLENGKK